MNSQGNLFAKSNFSGFKIIRTFQTIAQEGFRLKDSDKRDSPHFLNRMGDGERRQNTGAKI